MVIEFIEWFATNNTDFTSFADLYAFYFLKRKNLISTDYRSIPYLFSRIDKFNYKNQYEPANNRDLVIVKLLTEDVAYSLEDMEISVLLNHTINDPYEWCFWELLYGNVSEPTILQGNIEKELKSLDINNYFQVRLAQLINVGNTVVLPSYSEKTFREIVEAPYKIFLFDKTNQSLADKISTPLMFNVEEGDDLFMRFNDCVLKIENKSLQFGTLNEIPEVSTDGVERVNMFGFKKCDEGNVYFKFYRNTGGLSLLIFSRNADCLKKLLENISQYYVDSNLDFKAQNLITQDNVFWALIWKTNHANISIPQREIVYSPYISDLQYSHHIVRINTENKKLSIV